MPQDEREESLTVNYGKASLTARGVVVVIIICVAAVIVSNAYLVDKLGGTFEKSVSAHDEAGKKALEAQWKAIQTIEENRRKDRQQIEERLDVSNCISMFDFTERRTLREKQGGWWQVCPWLNGSYKKEK